MANVLRGMRRWRTHLLKHISQQQALKQAQRPKTNLQKIENYRALENRYVLFPVAAETMGPIDEGSLELLREIGRRLTEISGEPRESQFIFQRFSIILQRGNAASFKGSFVTPCLDAI